MCTCDNVTWFLPYPYYTPTLNGLLSKVKFQCWIYLQFTIVRMRIAYFWIRLMEISVSHWLSIEIH